MKALTAITIAAALFASAMPADAQNTAPTTKVSPSPSNINKSNRPTVPSGAEASPAAANQHAQLSGTGKFCKPRSANGRLDCRYASLSACQKHNRANNLHCVANPNTGS
jgi:hypothetical protein